MRQFSSDDQKAWALENKSCMKAMLFSFGAGVTLPLAIWLAFHLHFV